jgi:hypothetical protein
MSVCDYVFLLFYSKKVPYLVLVHVYLPSNCNVCVYDSTTTPGVLFLFQIYSLKSQDLYNLRNFILYSRASMTALPV